MMRVSKNCAKLIYLWLYLRQLKRILKPQLFFKKNDNRNQVKNSITAQHCCRARAAAMILGLCYPWGTANGLPGHPVSHTHFTITKGMSFKLSSSKSDTKLPSIYIRLCLVAGRCFCRGILLEISDWIQKLRRLRVGLAGSEEKLKTAWRA